MQERNFAEYQIRQFHAYLLREEKSAATVEKYLRDVRAFSAYVGKQSVTKDMVVAYKKHLQDAGYAARSINSMLASVNGWVGRTVGSSPSGYSGGLTAPKRRN